VTFIFKAVFFLCWFVYEFLLFAPHARRVRREKSVDTRISGMERIFPALAFLGMQILPLFYIFTPWLEFADHAVPIPTGAMGGILFAASLWIVGRAHKDLGRNWSPALQIKAGHGLVTQGIYRRIRHPIYLSQWLWCLAQALLLGNWLAGLAGLVSFIPVYFYRVPREEQMMLDHFGAEYESYMKVTGRILPKH
jgi:protein-S-isoprenylcysteine O-methyltransferase Ste14